MLTIKDGHLLHNDGSAKDHYTKRFDSEANMSMRTWCREKHSGCEICQAWLQKKK